MSNVRLAMVQMRHRDNVGGNVDAVVEKIEAAASDGAQVVCLQELFASAYPCQDEDHGRFDLAETIDGPTVRRIQKIASANSVVVVTPIFERRGPGVYHNTAVVVDADGTIAGTYRKMHIPDDPLFYEKFYFTPGDADEVRSDGFDVIQTRYARLGVGICWDQWFPEAARLFALAGAEIILYPTAIAWIDDEKDEFGQTQLDAWMTSMRAHAIANGVFVAAANRVGIEGRLQFWGHSFVAGPNGQTLAIADDSHEEIIVADCETAAIDVVRTHWPFLRDRRVDGYRNLTRRWID